MKVLVCRCECVHVCCITNLYLKEQGSVSQMGKGSNKVREEGPEGGWI